jgi:hypothetical protein
MNASIRSVCVRPQHRAFGSDPRTITVHDGAWAYCPDGAEGEHEWRTIEPIDLDELARSVRAEAAAAQAA